METKAGSEVKADEDNTNASPLTERFASKQKGEEAKPASVTCSMRSRRWLINHSKQVTAAQWHPSKFEVGATDFLQHAVFPKSMLSSRVGTISRCRWETTYC
jgi:hypothetical protein